MGTESTFSVGGARYSPQFSVEVKNLNSSIGLHGMHTDCCTIDEFILTYLSISLKNPIWDR